MSNIIDVFPIEPLEEESAKAFLAFQKYCQMSPDERSIDAAYSLASGRQKEGGKRYKGHWERWSRDFNWAERVKEYDTFVAQNLAMTDLQMRRQNIEKYHERFQENFTQSLKVGEVLLRKISNKAANEKKDMPLNDLRNLALAYTSVVNGQKVVFDQWSVLLGLDQMAHLMAAARNEKNSSN